MDPAEEEAAADLVAEETQGDGKCTEQHVGSVVKIAKFRFGQAVTGRYTAVTVLKKEETKTVEDQILRKGDHFRRIAGEMHKAETADN